MKKTILKINAFALAVLMVFAVISCKPETEESQPAEQKAGDVVSTGIKIGETTYKKTGEVTIILPGTTGVVDMKNDSSWNSYVPSTAEISLRGVFIKDRKVTLSPFVMGQYEVTQELYTAVMEVENPSNFKDSIAEKEIQKFRPVEMVSHYEAIAFCNELTKKTMKNADVVYFSDEAKTIAYSKDDAAENKSPYMDITKKGYRLPTEAEWEYAARGGNPQSAEWKNAFGKVNTKDGKMIYDEGKNLSEDENLSTVGWYSVNSDSKTHEVGLKNKNSLNLYDMAGNVWEWCWDWYVAEVTAETVKNPCGVTTGTQRVYRGGSYESGASYCAVSRRNYRYPDSQYKYIGFRVVRSIQ